VTAAAGRWRDALRAWAIPEEVLAAAPESPYGFPAESFRRRAERAAEADPTPTTMRALEALPERGVVLDVGVGSGATSLPLAARASRIVGVDESEGMLASFSAAVAASKVDAVAVKGSWPEIAPEVGRADVVVSGHVLYNVQDLPPFVGELTAHARHRVVVELTERHPLAWMHDLWRRFHDLPRPDGPTADDAEAVLREMGIVVQRLDRVVEATAGGFERREDAIALTRRRLCLTPDRDPEVAEALGDRLMQLDGLWSAGPQAQSIVTQWWDGAGGS
jgi:precorrin-6B methylase 2